MPRLRLSASAQDDLIGIFDYIAVESGSRKTARRFVAKLRERCAALAKQPATLGVARPELRPDIRSVPVGRYVIFLRYVDGVLEVVNIIEGHRDIARLFGSDPR